MNSFRPLFRKEGFVYNLNHRRRVALVQDLLQVAASVLIRLHTVIFKSFLNVHIRHQRIICANFMFLDPAVSESLSLSSSTNTNIALFF